MTNEVELTILLYAEKLKHDEEKKLKLIDADVWNVISKITVDVRAFWTSYSGSEGRTIKLCIPWGDRERTLFELPEEELADLSAIEMLKLVERKLDTGN